MSELAESVREAREKMKEMEELVAIDTNLSEDIENLVRSQMILVDEDFKRFNRELEKRKQWTEDG